MSSLLQLRHLFQRFVLFRQHCQFASWPLPVLDSFHKSHNRFSKTMGHRYQIYIGFCLFWFGLRAQNHGQDGSAAHVTCQISTEALLCNAVCPTRICLPMEPSACQLTSNWLQVQRCPLRYKAGKGERTRRIDEEDQEEEQEMLCIKSFKIQQSSPLFIQKN